jgi:putative endonuclease
MISGDVLLNTKLALIAAIPMRVVHFDSFGPSNRITDAIAVEQKLKGWSRNKKESLIRNDWKAIKFFATRRAGKPKK